MSIQSISTEQLRRMGEQVGLVLLGCGGDPQEWLDGINQILTEEGILKKGARFEEAYTFRHDGLTCLLFPFKKDMELDMGKLSVWRLGTHSTFGGTWLSDYVPNRLAASVEEVLRMNIGNTPAEFQTILGCTGAAAQVGNDAKVVWIQGNEAKGVSFMLISPDYSVEELLKIAESVQMQ